MNAELAARALQAVTGASADLLTVIEATEDVSDLLKLREDAAAAWLIFDGVVQGILEKADRLLVAKGV